MTHPDPPVVLADAPDAAAALRAGLEDHEAVLVARGVTFTEGAVGRLVAALHRPHRRLVRVHTAGGRCYLARTELLRRAVNHGVLLEDLLADEPGLDRAIAEATGAVPTHGPTPVEDPASGRWRTWVDGTVVGVRSESESPDAAWQRAVSRSHGRPARLVTAARRRVGRARREVARLRQRP